MSGLFGKNIFTIAQKSLDFRTSRHDLLASNVANKDTPGYQTSSSGRVWKRRCRRNNLDRCSRPIPDILTGGTLRL